MSLAVYPSLAQSERAVRSRGESRFRRADGNGSGSAGRRFPPRPTTAGSNRTRAENSEKRLFFLSMSSDLL